MPGKKKTDKPNPIRVPQEQVAPSVEDQTERGYYYDDAHGYEKYDPQIEDQENEESPGDQD
ncbi:MAG: hypothetical protein OEM82_09895 [Acidobacteriota bacterium]|nr:hypothetical protein [Acidobacteriota bacterium]